MTRQIPHWVGKKFPNGRFKDYYVTQPLGGNSLELRSPRSSRVFRTPDFKRDGYSVLKTRPAPGGDEQLPLFGKALSWPLRLSGNVSGPVRRLPRNAPRPQRRVMSDADVAEWLRLNRSAEDTARGVAKSWTAKTGWKPISEMTGKQRSKIPGAQRKLSELSKPTPEQRAFADSHRGVADEQRYALDKTPQIPGYSSKIRARRQPGLAGAISGGMFTMPVWGRSAQRKAGAMVFEGGNAHSGVKPRRMLLSRKHESVHTSGRKPRSRAVRLGFNPAKKGGEEARADFFSGARNESAYWDLRNSKFKSGGNLLAPDKASAKEFQRGYREVSDLLDAKAASGQIRSVGKALLSPQIPFQRVLHGTSAEASRKILREGFRPNLRGDVYASSRRSRASLYALNPTAAQRGGKPKIVDAIGVGTPSRGLPGTHQADDYVYPPGRIFPIRSGPAGAPGASRGGDDALSAARNLRSRRDAAARLRAARSGEGDRSV